MEFSTADDLSFAFYLHVPPDFYLKVATDGQSVKTIFHIPLKALAKSVSCLK